jgi:CBS domain-containing protein
MGLPAKLALQARIGTAKEAPMATPTKAHRPIEFTALRAVDVMQRELVTVHASDPLREVERVLVDAQISAVPVLDDDLRVLGIVSMRDVVSRYAADHDLPDDADEDSFGDDIDETEPVAYQRLDVEPCAGDVMATDLVSVGPNALLTDVARRMVDNGTHRVLVIDRQRLLGLVSTMDVLRAIAGGR